MKTQKFLYSKSGRKTRMKGLPGVTESEQQFDAGLYSKFKKFMNEQKLRELKLRLHQFYGKNFPINYKPAYNFNEEWENQREQLYDKSQLQVINKTAPGSLISVLIMLMLTVSIWASNLNQFFSATDEVLQFNVEAQVLALIGQFLDVCVKIWFNAVKNREGKEALAVSLAKLYFLNALCIVYLSMAASQNTLRNDKAWLCFQLVAQLIMYWRAKRIYESFHYLNFALKYEYQFKAFDLILNLLVFAHFISIILFSVTKLHEVNWFAALNLESPTELTKYIYSFYFCTTTILTVGYGDISPKNPTEIVVVTCLEVFGIIIFGYLVNEIGYNLSALRKRRESVKKELNLIEKMRKYYRMSDDLIHKARAYLINRQPESEQLSPEEESGLMAKLNEELRNQIMSSTSLSIVKSSIFFLCRWSKSMQHSVASRLVHALFSPGEQLYQPEGRERIYLLRLGRIDVYTERRGNRLGNKSVLKEVGADLDRQVSNNCYGYTAVISARPVRLYAISKEYTSAYFIEKGRFQECIRGKSTDFEYYHEVKNRIDQSELWESLEVPSLSNSKHHYTPTHLHVIRKAIAQASHLNLRAPFVREQRRIFRGGNVLHDPEELKNIQRIFIPSLEDSNINIEETITKSKGNSSTEIQKISTQDDIENAVQWCDVKKWFHHYFEAGKDYSNYFTDHNQQQVLHKLEKEYLHIHNPQESYDLSMKTYVSTEKYSLFI